MTQASIALPRLDAAQQRAVFETLLSAARASTGAPLAQRWAQLEAAHVVGQTDFGLHLRSHQAMLALAWQTRDLQEVMGQALRLALVPLGHLLNRLPVGNTGRSRVSAFQPMAVAPEMAGLIKECAASREAATAFQPPKR